MLWTRSELKGRAKFLLKQNYWYSVLAALIYTFLLGNGFTYSYNVLKNKNSEVETSIQGFHPILMFGIAEDFRVSQLTDAKEDFASAREESTESSCWLSDLICS